MIHVGRSVCHVEMFLESHTHSIHETGIFTYYFTIKINKIHYILLMEEILHHLGCQNSFKSWDKLPNSTGEFPGFLVAINFVYR